MSQRWLPFIAAGLVGATLRQLAGGAFDPGGDPRADKHPYYGDAAAGGAAAVGSDGSAVGGRQRLPPNQVCFRHADVGPRPRPGALSVL